MELTVTQIIKLCNHTKNTRPDTIKYYLISGSFLYAQTLNVYQHDLWLDNLNLICERIEEVENKRMNIPHEYTWPQMVFKIIANTSSLTEVLSLIARESYRIDQLVKIKFKNMLNKSPDFGGCEIKDLIKTSNSNRLIEFFDSEMKENKGENVNGN